MYKERLQTCDKVDMHVLEKGSMLFLEVYSQLFANQQVIQNKQFLNLGSLPLSKNTNQWNDSSNKQKIKVKSIYGPSVWKLAHFRRLGRPATPCPLGRLWPIPWINLAKVIVLNTPPKFNSSPLKSYLSNRKVVFQPPFFRGYVKLRGL